jgi:DNA-binding transcriptional MerR regulator
MTRQTYTTKEIAEQVGIHVNTVRFYEEIGFLTKPERLKNGYRVYTDLQLEQCRLARRAMKAEVLQNGLRKKAVGIVQLCAALDFDAALSTAREYRLMIKSEILNAKSAIAAVENILYAGSDPEVMLTKRQDAAKALRVTSETLRTWERSGLVKIKRGANGYRVYSAEDMERLNIIRTLRCANYSLSAILRLLNRLDRHEVWSVETILNTPGENEDIISVCDRLILSLQSTASDAEQIIEMLQSIKENFSTLH